MIGVITELILFAINILIFFFIGGFSYTQSFVLAVVVCLVIDKLRSNSKKINLTISIVWSNLFEHPEFPKKERSRLINILGDLNKGIHEKRSLLPNPLTYFIEGNLNYVWAEHYKSFLSPSLTPSVMGTPVLPRRYIFFSHILSEPHKQKDYDELLLAIREEKDYIRFILVIEKPGFNIEEKEICKFPLSLLMNKNHLFLSRTLKKYHFNKIDDEYKILSFENRYFKIEIEHIDAR